MNDSLLKQWKERMDKQNQNFGFGISFDPNGNFDIFTAVPPEVVATALERMLAILRKGKPIQVPDSALILKK